MILLNITGLLLILSVTINLISAQCKINIQTDMPVKDPVYIKYNNGAYELWTPTNGYLNFTANEVDGIACTGSGNVINTNAAVSAPVTCISGTTLGIGATNMQSTLLDCKSTITGDILNTGTVCGNSAGVILNIGFKAGTYGFLPLIQSCYNMKTASVIYTRHIIYGKTIDFAVIESNRPGFKTSGTPSTVSPATSYTQASQLTRFTTLLGSATEAAKYINSKSFLSRGHLAPDGDGIFRSWQFATYFYTNVAPEWQDVNAGNWLRVEDAARTIAAKLQENILIFTGVHDILSLPDVNGKSVPIILEAGGIETPKWFWKIIKSTKSNSGVALISLNNPFATVLPPTEMLCPDVCQATGWSNVQYNDFTKGFTYCCTVADLMKAVSSIPVEAAVANTLNFI